MYPFSCVLWAIFWSLRQIARYLPHHRSENASKTHPKSLHDKFKTASDSLVRKSSLVHGGRFPDMTNFCLQGCQGIDEVGVLRVQNTPCVCKLYPDSFQKSPETLDFAFGLYYLCVRLPFMVSVPKPYVFGSETIRSWFGNRMVLGRKP